MRIRLGYVAIALNLDKVTSSSTLTYSRYLKMDEETLEPTVLPDYRLKKCIGAEKGLVHRYGIEKIGANREENQD